MQNILEDMNSLLGLNHLQVIEHIESKLSHCYEVVAKDDIINERGYSCGIEYRKPFNGTMYLDFKNKVYSVGITLQFDKQSGLFRIYQVTCKKR